MLDAPHPALQAVFDAQPTSISDACGGTSVQYSCASGGSCPTPSGSTYTFTAPGTYTITATVRASTSGMPGLLLAKQMSIILTCCCTVQMPLPFLHICPAAMCRMQDGAGNSVSGSSTVIVNPPSQAIPCDTPSWPSTATFQCSSYGTADVSLIAI